MTNHATTAHKTISDGEMEWTPHIERASDQLREERTRTAAERDAFAAFRTCVTELDTASSPSTASLRAVATNVLTGTQHTNSQLERLREQYRTTAMSVPHFEEEYDESLAEHLTAELGEEIATQVVHGDRFTPTLKTALVDASETARDARESFIGILDDEQTELNEAQRTITTIERWFRAVNTRPLGEWSFDELFGAWETLIAMEHRCATVLQTRQQHLHRPGRTARAEQATLDLNQYMYQPLETDYPVLRDVLQVLETVRQARHRIETGLINTP